MPPFKTALVILVFALSFAMPVERGFAKKDPPPVLDPALDPLSKEAGNFLDADLAALRGKAEAAYAAGDMKGAAGAYLELLLHDNLDATALYNLACCYGRLGEAAKAARFLVKAVEVGFEDIGLARQDPDFNLVRSAPVFGLAVDAVAARLRDREAHWGETLLLDAPAPFACRVKIPPDLEKLRSPTLLVALHGFASRPETLSPLWDALEKPSFVFAAPQAPFALPGRTRPVFSWRAPIPDDTRKENLRALDYTERYLLAVIRELKQRYGAGKIFLMGFSQGAFFTYGVGLRHPELLAGLLCFSGRLPQDLLDEPILKAGASLPIFIAHGVQDTAVRPSEGERALTLLKEHGYGVTMVRFEGGHEVPDAVFRQAVEWMAPVAGTPRLESRH